MQPVELLQLDQQALSGLRGGKGKSGSAEEPEEGRWAAVRQAHSRRVIAAAFAIPNNWWETGQPGNWLSLLTAAATAATRQLRPPRARTLAVSTLSTREAVS